MAEEVRRVGGSEVELGYAVVKALRYRAHGALGQRRGPTGPPSVAILGSFSLLGITRVCDNVAVDFMGVRVTGEVVCGCGKVVEAGRA